MKRPDDLRKQNLIPWKTWVVAGLFLVFMVTGKATPSNDSTNLADVYEYLHFDPYATNCAVMVQISDVHINLNTVDPVYTTNIDPRVISMINAIRPQPQVLVDTGDTCSYLGAAAPGFSPRIDLGTNELKLGWSELGKLTNHGAFYIIPGNHDSPFTNYANPYYTGILGLPRYTNFTIAGLTVVMLDTQNQGYIDPEQIKWLATKREHPDRTKPILVMSHFPLLGQDQATFGRESTFALLWFIDRWKAPIWLGIGHTHGSWLSTFQHQGNLITEVFCTSANPVISRGPVYTAQASGFEVWCITNGNVSGVIRGISANAHYTVQGVESAFPTAEFPYDGVTNVLFRADEGHFKRSDYSISMASVGGKDCVYWFIYGTNYTVRLPMEEYPSATRALFLLARTVASKKFFLSADGTNWTEYPREFIRSSVESVVIPTHLRNGPLWARVSGGDSDEFWPGGFGLGTTNYLSAYGAWAGKNLGDSTIPPSADIVKNNMSDVNSLLSPGMTAPEHAMTLYAFGLNARYPDETPVQAGRAWLGGRPAISWNSLRLACRDTALYNIEHSSALPATWSTATNFVLGASINGWHELVITNIEPPSFYRFSFPTE